MTADAFSIQQSDSLNIAKKGQHDLDPNMSADWHPDTNFRAKQFA